MKHRSAAQPGCAYWSDFIVCAVVEMALARFLVQDELSMTHIGNGTGEKIMTEMLLLACSSDAVAGVTDEKHLLAGSDTRQVPTPRR